MTLMEWVADMHLWMRGALFAVAVVGFGWLLITGLIRGHGTRLDRFFLGVVVGLLDANAIIGIVVLFYRGVTTPRLIHGGIMLLTVILVHVLATYAKAERNKLQLVPLLALYVLVVVMTEVGQTIYRSFLERGL
ncbi:MAG: hypothetical protein HKN21_00830 [Candidatus Eisenbacteria bacterium]|uniref:DUF2231 domain-containing protein n=1 Tax=Eiseniibacteriota bacterium TaxID=2212470 RepID=A0A7Y2E4W7_UNCEI|nr:hypothetical protein [Candidatus Eisenbacteria bacterium]